MNPTRTVSISIRRTPADTYAYLAEPANFPRWSAFITRIEPRGDRWAATTPGGEVLIRFTPPNTFRVLDHDVTVSPELTVHVPMRVLPNGDDGCEVIFTIFRRPGMDDHQFEADVLLVLADLTNLKRVLEGEPPAA